MTTDVLDNRSLNRALLARQWLLARRPATARAAVEHLVGMQAQNPLDPYPALWSRLDGFDPGEVGRALEDRTMVRILVMRGTIHLVTADDALRLRPLTQPALDKELLTHSEHGAFLRTIDAAATAAEARPLLAEPRSGIQLKALLAERFPGRPPGALAFLCRNLLPLAQPPPRGVWGRKGQVTQVDVERWLGRPLEAAPSVEDVVLRYLAAFGPATAADVSAWSGLPGMRAVLDRLGPRLRTFADERGRALVDLPDAPRPGPDTPAPVRFLPEYDNVLLSHADRARVVPPERRGALGYVMGHRGSFLLDGFVAGAWSATTDARAGTTTVEVLPLVPLAGDDEEAVGAAAAALAGFLAPGFRADVVVRDPLPPT